MDVGVCILRPFLACFQCILGSKLEREFLAQESDALESRKLGLGGCTTLLMSLNSTVVMETILAIMPPWFFLMFLLMIYFIF